MLKLIQLSFELARRKFSGKKQKQYSVYALISGHPWGGGGDPGTYGGIARDLLAFVVNVWPGTGALDRFCTSEARYSGKIPRDL